jgi:hypothetical protein
MNQFFYSLISSCKVIRRESIKNLFLPNGKWEGSWSNFSWWKIWKKGRLIINFGDGHYFIVLKNYTLKIRIDTHKIWNVSIHFNNDFFCSCHCFQDVFDLRKKFSFLGFPFKKVNYLERCLHSNLLE